MFTALDRVSNRTAWLAFALGLGASAAAALLTPQDQTLGASVRLVVWHGMALSATVVAVIAAGVLAVHFLMSRRREAYAWARALQLVTLPVWVAAIALGEVSARLIWGAWDLTESRMVMGVAYAAVAAAALIVSLLSERERVGAVGQVVGAAAIAVGVAWVQFFPAATDVHPADAVLGSGDPAFAIAAAVMFAGCLVAVCALAVPVRRWLAHPAG